MTTDSGARSPARRGTAALRSILRWTRRLLTGVVALVGLAAGGVALALWWSTPATDDDLRLAGLAGPVTIQLDPDGIPWIKAASETDAATAIGYMHARDRMFQMDLMRRAASGRLSELAGAVTLRLDRTNRTLGLRRRAEAELAGLEPAARAMLDAYAVGVNAYISEHGRFTAPEFILLGTPEPWTPVDSLLWGKTMAQYLAGNWRTELNRAELAPKLSPAVQRALWPNWPGTARPDAALGPTRWANLIPSFPAPFTLPAEASNEWAVDGSHTTTGAPLLAGDPHLGLSFPAIWYLARIDTPGPTLAGAFAPGIPFLVIGRNATLAWTFTTTGADTQDVFVETPTGTGSYATPDGPKPFLTREERIAVRGAPDDILTIRETRHGPVLSDLDPNLSKTTLAVSMASLIVPDTSAAGLLALNRAGTVAEAGIAGAAITAPVQNLLVATRTGIAQYTTGRVPRRRTGDGSVPVDGADGAHDWTGFAGGLDLPHVVAPRSGRIVNANEPVAPPGFPVFMGAEQYGDWRARRIRTMLDAAPKHDRSSFAAMQVDVISDFAREVLPVMLATAPNDAASERVLALLRGWDGSMRLDLPQPLVFNAWVRRFHADLLGDLGIPDAPIGPTIDIVGQALARGGTVLCNGDCTPLLTRSLAETVAALPPGWERQEWGTAHQANFAHPLLGNLPLVGAAATWSIPQPGDDGTIFRGAMRAPGYASLHGPAYRGVYDLSDLDASLFGLAPGQTGNPFSPDAAIMLQRWRDGVPIRLGAAPESVDGTIELHP